MEGTPEAAMERVGATVTRYQPSRPETALWIANDPWDEATIPPRRWLAFGYLLRGAVTVLSGPGAVSKSSLALGWAVAGALGHDLNRFRPRESLRSLVFNTEDDADEQHRRLSAVLRHFGATPADLKSNVVLIGPRRVGTLLEQEAATGAIRPTPAMKELVAAIEAFHPDVLMLDPLVELHTVEENANTGVRAVMAEIRALAVHYDMAVLVVHHAKKGAADSAGDMDTVRGASAITGLARVVLTLTTMKPEEAKAFGMAEDDRNHFFRLDGAKSNYAPIQDAEWFERNAFELDNGDVVAVPVPWEAPDTAVNLEIRFRVEKGIAEGSPEGPWSPKLDKGERSVARLMEKCGVTFYAAQKRLLRELLTNGYAERTYQKPNRSKGKGICTPEGKPDGVHWVEEGTPARAA